MAKPFASSSAHASATVHDVAVVGQGAVGAAMALAAARAGCRTVAISPVAAGAPRPGVGGAPHGADDWDARVYAISPASRALLESLRIWEALDPGRVAPVYDMEIHSGAPAVSDSMGAPAVEFSAYEAGIEALAWIIEGRQIEATLGRALGFSAVDRVEGRVVATQVEAGLRTLSLEDGRTLRARLVIAADGAQSPLREQFGLGTHAHDYGHRAVVANFVTGVAHQDVACQWFTDEGVLALLPLPGARCSMVWSVPEAVAEGLLALGARALALRVSEASGGRFGVLEALTPARSFALHRIDVATVIAPRAVLIGDAAHVIHPLAGQGMNLGFGDVASLGALLAARESFRDPGDPLLLRRHQRARREPVLAMSLACDGLHRLFDAEVGRRLGPLGGPLGLVRDLGWRAVAGSSWLRRRLITAAAQA